jgi:hypothetical protein
MTSRGRFHGERDNYCTEIEMMPSFSNHILVLKGPTDKICRDSCLKIGKAANIVSGTPYCGCTSYPYGLSAASSTSW